MPSGIGRGMAVMLALVIFMGLVGWLENEKAAADSPNGEKSVAARVGADRAAG
jgi:hypothetical protein